ncbi:cytochrome P450 [Nonomuraea roseoviolacea]|uniref:Cytochrome P450 n=1 Tax=Nonomuraea roseoviolacea subsp. carminata TaxID=160689 RepID=A0ABT1K8M1_9ACTN|nr:cytochrome P450 [Nonomuraea roseoviolacea]MCP2350353.1 cytochrome P450 [Nonomuraea roseoviolacea subsp. carminata]
MPLATDPTVTKPRVLPFYRAVPRLMKDPVAELARMGTDAGGRIVRLDIGPFRPYLVSHPDHVQQVLKTQWSNFAREGMFWRPLRRVTGRSILGDGEGWASSRRILQPLFTARRVASLAEDMAEVVAGHVGELERDARTGRLVDAAHLMTTITNQTVIKVLFGGRISREVGERLLPEFATCATSIGFRLLFPFVPYSMRVPGDRAFLAAAQRIDDIVYPLIEEARAEDAPDGDDGGRPDELVSALIRARMREDGAADLRQVRDDLVSIYGAASETTAMALTWLWTLLHDHPEVNARLRDEIEWVVGDGPVRPSHVQELPYLRMVLQELLRVHPPGWIIPRQVVADTEIGGVPVKAGSQVLVSPYTTHRLEEFWERPLEFDPERWAPEREQRRHRYAYVPFGAGPHVCLGQHLFHLQAALVVAGLLARYRPVLTNPQRFTLVPGASVRPKEALLLRLLPSGTDEEPDAWRPPVAAPAIGVGGAHDWMWPMGAGDGA